MEEDRVVSREEFLQTLEVTDEGGLEFTKENLQGLLNRYSERSREHSERAAASSLFAKDKSREMIEALIADGVDEERLVPLAAFFAARAAYASYHYMGMHTLEVLPGLIEAAFEGLIGRALAGSPESPIFEREPTEEEINEVEEHEANK